MGLELSGGGLQHLHEFVERILFSHGLNLKFSILHFDSVGMVQGKGQIGQFFFFQFSYQFLVLFGRTLACIIFKDGFRGFARRSIKQNNGGYIFTELF